MKNKDGMIKPTAKIADMINKILNDLGADLRLKFW